MVQASLRRWVSRVFRGRSSTIRTKIKVPDHKSRLKLEWLEGRDVPSTSFPLNASTWTAMGPSPISNGETPGNLASTGRFNSVAVDPLNDNILYAASDVAGIWRSLDGGQHWTPLTDQIDRHPGDAAANAAGYYPQNQSRIPVNRATNIKIVHQSALSPTTVYATSTLGGNGFFYVLTVDTAGNTTFTRRGPTAIAGPVAGLSQFNARTINNYVVVPSGGTGGADLIYAAVTGGAAATRSGIYRSKDSGVTWDLITASGIPIAVNAGVTDVDIDSTNKNIVYATVSAPAAQAGVYRCTNAFTTVGAAANNPANTGGANWQLRLGGSQFFSGTLISRLVTTVSPVLSNIVYVAAADSNTGSAFAVYRSTDSGVNWTPYTTTAFSPLAVLPDFTNGNAATYMDLLVDPSSPANPSQQRVYMVGYGDTANNILLVTSMTQSPTAATFTDISVQSGDAAYSGVLGLTLDSQHRLLVATEGGVYRRQTVAGNPDWVSLNGTAGSGLNSIVVDGLGLHPTNPDVAIINDSPFHTAALFQDSKAWKTTDSNFTAPYHVLGNNPQGIGAVLYDLNTPGAGPGDGLVWRVAQDSPTTEDIRLSQDGGLTWGDVLPGVPLGDPVIMNPSDPRHLLIGNADDVYDLSYDATGQFSLNNFGTIFGVQAPWSAQNNAVSATAITAMGVSRQSGIVWVATTPVEYDWESKQPNSVSPTAPFAPRTRLYALDPSGGFSALGADWVDVQLPTAISGNTAGTVPPDTITNLLLDPNNQFRIYLTTASGGVWAQTNTLAIRLDPFGNIIPEILPDPNPPPGPGGTVPPSGDTFPPPPDQASINSKWTLLNPSGVGNTRPQDIIPNATGANALALDPYLGTDQTDDALYLATNDGLYQLSGPGLANPTSKGATFVWKEIGLDANANPTLPNTPVISLQLNTSTGIMGVGLAGRGVYELQIRSQLSGTVFVDTNGNDFKDAGEPGTANRIIGLYDVDLTDPNNPVYSLFATATTDANGHYDFFSVPSSDFAGTQHKWALKLFAQPGWVQTTADPVLLDIPTNSVTVLANQNFGTFQRASISGIKFNDANGNGVRDSGELGMPNFVFYIDANNNGVRNWTDANADGLWEAGEGEPWTTSAADGSYSFNFLTPEWINGQVGNYPTDSIYYGLPGTAPPEFVVREDLTLQPTWSQTSPLAGGAGVEPPAAGGGPAAGPGWHVSLTSNQSVLNRDFGNIQPGSISGRKFLDVNSNGRFETGEPGIDGTVAATAFRFFIDANHNNVLDWTDSNSNGAWDVGEGEQWTHADVNGFFQFTAMPPGTYRIRESMGSVTGWVQTTTNPADVTLTGTNSASGMLFGNVQQANFRVVNNWTPIGPAPQLNGGTWGNLSVSGRVVNIAPDPNNPNRYFDVTDGGGIWRTNDGGVSWANVTDGIQWPNSEITGTTSVSAAAVAPSDSNTVYAAAGRGFIKSTDGGLHWLVMTDGPTSAVRMIVDKIDKNIVFAAGGDGKLWRTTDGGLNWRSFFLVDPVIDIQVDPTNPNIVYAAASNVQGDSANGIYRTSDALSNNPAWLLMFGGSAQIPGSSIGNIQIAMAPSQPSTLYTVLTTAEIQGKSFFLAAYRSNDSGVNWTNLVNMPDIANDQGTFDLAIAVSPTNPNVVFAGGDGTGPSQAINVIVNTNDGGNTWTQTVFDPNTGPVATSGPHTDVHAIYYDASGRLLVGSDGGMFRLNNATLANNSAPPAGGVTPVWQSLNGTGSSTAGLNSIEFIGIATHPTDPNKIAGGSQDNGVAVTNGKIQWTQTDGGDAGQVLWDFDRPNNLYRIAPIGSVGANSWVQKSADGGQTWFDATDGIQGQTGQNTLFYAPIVMDPGNSQRLFTGTDKVWASITGAEPLTVGTTTIPGWSQNVNINNLPSGITGASATIPDTPLTGSTPPIPIDGIGIGRLDPNALYISQGGRLFTIEFRVNPPLQTADWVDITPPGAGPNPPAFTKILLDPNHAGVIYVVDSSNGDVWRSVNGGNTWTNIDGTGTGRFSGNAGPIAIDPRPNDPADILYIGTGDGVYGLVNPRGNAAVWFRVGDVNIPQVNITDLNVNTTTGILAAATYGHGVWETRIRGDIRGLVYNDVNGDGVQETGENGISGLTIRLLDATPGASFGSVIATTVTSAQGNYEFASLRNGNYMVRMVTAANQVQTTADPGQYLNFTEQSIALASFNGTPPLGITVDPQLNFGNFTLGSISGIKFDDLNQNGVRDVGEGTLAGFVIYFDANNNSLRDAGEQNVTSAADGSYTLTGFGPNVVRGVPSAVQAPFHIREDLTGQTGWTQTFAPPPITLTSGQNLLGQNFGNARPGSIRGQVFFDVNADTIVNPGEPGENNWRVYIDANSNGLFDTGETFVRTDASGAFSFSLLPAGTYKVRVDLAEQAALGQRWFQTTPDPNDIILTGGNSAGGIVFGVFQSFNPWIEIGPRPITNGQVPGHAPATGRFDTVAVDPTDPNVMYAGSSGGGIWRSTDSGNTWTVRSEALPDLFINTVKTFHRSGGNTVYAAATTGVYVSIDGGTNFTLHLVPGGGITAMDAVASTTSPNNPAFDILYVTGAAGVLRSTDGGASWVNISNGFPGGAAGQPYTDIKIEPGQVTPNVVYVAIGDPNGVANSGVYRIDNAMTAGPGQAGTWVLRLGGSAFVPGVEPGVFRIAIAPNAPSTLFVAVAERNAPLSGISRLLAIFRSFDSGINWTGLYDNQVIPTGNVPNYMDIFGNRNNSIIVAPFVAGSPGVPNTDPTHQVLVVGGYGDGQGNVLISFDSGTTWQQANDVTAGSNGVGPSVDVHGFTFDSQGRLLAATEAGVYRLSTVSQGGGRNWVSLNGTPGLGSLNTVTVAPQGLATNPTNAYEMFINAGIDHTSEMYNNRLPVGYGWTSLDTFTTGPFQQNFLARHGAGPGRDGLGYVFYNYNDPNTIYRVVDFAGGNDNDWIRKGTRQPNGTWVWTSSAQSVPGVPGNPDHLPAVIIDPSNSNHIWAGTTQVAISNNGGQSWSTTLQTSISSSTPVPDFPNQPNPRANVTALAVSRTPNPLGTPNIYAGWNNGFWLMRSMPVAAPPSQAATSDQWERLDGGNITQIIVDPNDPLNVYYVDGQNVKNWSHGTVTILNNIGDPTRPNLPPSAPGALSIGLDPRVAANPADDVLYLGTSSGVYRLVNPSAATNPGPFVWVKVGTGLPNEPITALDVNSTTGLLTAGTAGRGVWQVQIRAMIGGVKYEDLNGNGTQDVGEPPMAGVVMRVIDNSTNGVIATTVTDANGFYEFRSLRAGSYRVQEVVPNGSVQTSTSPPVFTLGETDAALVSYPLPGAVPASVQLVPQLAFGNYRLATISGTKFEDRNNNGTRDTGEPGLAGFVFYNDANGNGARDWTDTNSDGVWESGEGERWTTTDANGNYSFTGLTPGTYTIREVPQTGWTQTSVNPAPITPLSNQVVGGIDFGNIRKGHIAGSIFNDLNGDSSRTPNEPGLSMTLQLLDASTNGVIRTLTSAADGTYDFLSLPAGDYLVRQVLPSGWIERKNGPISANPTSTPPGKITIPGNAADPTPPFDGEFGDFKLFTVSGIKFEDLNGDGVRGPGENGLGGFVITVRNTATNETFTGVSDANGNYSIPNIGPGNFVVTETQKTGWTQTSANPASFQGTSGTDRSFNFGNFHLISVSGSVYNDANNNGVKDAGEIGLPGFIVVLDKNNDGSPDATAISDANGNYSFTGIAPGNYAIRQNPRNGWRVTSPVGGQYLFTAVSSLNQTGRDFGNRNSQVYVTARDAGSVPMVSVRNAADNSEAFNFLAYTSGFRGGVRVATGYLNGPGTAPMIVTAAGSGGGPHVRVFDSATGEDKWGGGFFAYDSRFSGGVFVAVGDVNGDGYDDIITAPGAGGGPHVKVYSGKDRSLLNEFFAYSASWTGGVHVAAADVDGDGKADIITGAGAGGGPHVRVFSGADGHIIEEFFAYDSSFHGGVFVAAGDVNGDGKADIITSPGAGGGPHVRVFNGANLGILGETFAYEGSYSGGVRVGVLDVNFDGRADLITAPGASRQPTVNEFVLNGSTLNRVASFNTFDPTFLGGVFVG
ncbi:MAG: SdrD B-like domain-containing protein [Gemmataceae bacterium]